MPTMDSLFVAYESAKENTMKGDFIDRLHSKITVVFLFAICVLIGFKQFDETQIMCWLPTQFSDEQTDYVHQLCWVNNTYYYPDVTDADLFPESNKNILLYYQYILFILFGQALLFYLPTMTWMLLAKNSIGYMKKLFDQCQRMNVFKAMKERREAESKDRNFNEKVYEVLKKVFGVNDLDSLREILSGKDDEPHHRLLRSLDEQKSQESNIETEDELNFRPLLLDKGMSDQLKNQFKLIVSLENENNETTGGDEEKGFVIQPDNNDAAEDRKEAFDATDELYQKKTVFGLKQSFSKRVTNLSLNRAPKVLQFMKPRVGVEHLARNYMLLKLLNLFNVLIQIYFLHFMFGDRFYLYGVDFMVSLWKSENPFFMTTHFPIVTFCDFHVFQNLRKTYFNTAQCILPINVLIEKFFLLVWFWYYLLIFLTVLNIIAWSFEFIRSKKLGFLRKYLEIRLKMGSKRRTSQLSEASSYFEDDLIDKFYATYLGNDGLIMLHLVKSLAGQIIFMDFLGLLWIDFKIEFKKAKKN